MVLTTVAALAVMRSTGVDGDSGIMKATRVMYKCDGDVHMWWQ